MQHPRPFEDANADDWAPTDQDWELNSPRVESSSVPSVSSTRIPEPALQRAQLQGCTYVIYKQLSAFARGNGTGGEWRWPDIRTRRGQQRHRQHTQEAAVMRAGKHIRGAVRTQVWRHERQELASVRRSLLPSMMAHHWRSWCAAMSAASGCQGQALRRASHGH
jgi:hypothetical protein